MEKTNKQAGYIAISRGITDHWLFKETRKLSRFEAWFDMLLMAQYTPGEVKRVIKGSLISSGRGQFIASLRFLALRWGWGKDKVGEFLKILKEDGMIKCSETPGGTKIELVNYEKYNKTRQQTGQQKQDLNDSGSITLEKNSNKDQTVNRTQNRQRADTEPTNINKENQEKINESEVHSQNFSEEEKEEYNRAMTAISNKYPSLLNFEVPFSVSEILSLKNKYEGWNVFEPILKKMNNHKGITKKRSAYQTFIDWKDAERDPQLRQRIDKADGKIPLTANDKLKRVIIKQNQQLNGHQS